MKIGLLTLPLHTNYGGNLQACALITVLKELGHDAWLIKWEKVTVPLWKAPLTITKRLVLKFIYGKKGVDIGSGIFDRRQRRITEMHARQFISSRITPQTIGFMSTSALSRKIGMYRFDAIVVGSDQVWRSSPNIEDYFLSFLAETDNTTRRVAFAASFGTDQLSYNQQQFQNCAHLLKKFSAVSVREESGVDLCRQHFGVEAAHVIDPTLILPQGRYVDLAWRGHSLPRSSGGKGLFVYFLDTDSDKAQTVEFISSCLAMRYFSMTLNTGDILPSAIAQAVPPVEQWLRNFDEADFIVTDSFHGCVFSIIFNKPFIAYGNISRGLSRFESLLKLFNLDERLISSSTLLSQEIICHPIDWSSVNSNISRQRDLAINFLKTSLKR